MALALLAGGAAAVWPHGEFFVPIAISALLLAALNGRRERFSLDALRVLADVALLVPAAGWVLPLFHF